MQCSKFKQQPAITSKRLEPTSVTLNDPERRNSPNFALFHQVW